MDKERLFERTKPGGHSDRRAGGYRIKKRSAHRCAHPGHVKHPHGIKVMLEEGNQVGQVKSVLSKEQI